MRTPTMLESGLVTLLAIGVGQFSSFSQIVTLSGTNYTEKFDNIGSGLPNGWTVRTGATAANPGNVAAFFTTVAAWKLATAGQFSNLASTTGDGGGPFNGTEDATIQATTTNRAPGVRISNAINPGAAFVLQAQNTVGFTNFLLDLDFLTLTTNSRPYVWTIDYALGATPVSFAALGSFSDSNLFGGTHFSLPLPIVVSDQGENLWIRIALLTNAATSGSHDTFAIDNVSLNWTALPPSTNKPAVTTQPQSRTNNATSAASFTVGASGASPLSYQWRKSGTDLADGGTVSGANASALLLSPVLAGDAGNYSVVITNSYGSVTSDIVRLTVIDPVIISSPSSRTNVAGDNVFLSATVGGTTPLTYQWKRNGADIPGASGQFPTTLTNNTLALTNVQSSNQGAYMIVISNSVNAVTSIVANLTLLATPSIRLAGWTFNSEPPDDDPATGLTIPALGSGMAMLLSGNTESFLNGSLSDPGSVSLDNSAWNIKGYPLQGTLNKEGGVRFNVSTLGYQDVLLTWEQQHNSRASRYVRLQYSTNGADFIDGKVIDMGGVVGTFALTSADLSSRSGVNDNSNFAFRIVTEFESTAIGTTNGNYVATDATQSYGSTAGAIRYDVVNVFGNVLAEARPAIMRIEIAAGNVRIDFTASPADAAADFVLQSSVAVGGAYGDVSASITQFSPGVFRAERAIQAAQQFYRIRR